MKITDWKLLLPAIILSSQITFAYGAEQRLEKLVEMALDKHPDVIRSRAVTAEGQYRLEAAQGGYLPTIDITADVGFEQVDNSSTRASGNDDKTWDRSQVGFEVRQNIFDGYNTRYDVERNKYYTQARNIELKGVREDIALNISQVFFELKKQRALYELAKENLTNHEDIYRQIRSRVDQGIGTRADLSQIQSRLHRANASFIAAENSLFDAETNYQRAIGEAPPINLVEFQLDESLLPANRAEAERLALTENFTVQASAVDIDEARSQLKGTKSSMLPSFDVVVAGDYGHDVGGSAGIDKNYSATVEMRWNVFNGGKDKANSQAASMQVEQAIASNTDAIRQVRQAIQLSWSAYDSLGRQREYLAEYINSAELTRDAYHKEFNLGKRTLINLLDSETEVFTSNTQYLNAHYAFEISKIRVLNSLGKLTNALALK